MSENQTLLAWIIGVHVFLFLITGLFVFISKSFPQKQKIYQMLLCFFVPIFGPVLTLNILLVSKLNKNSSTD